MSLPCARSAFKPAKRTIVDKGLSPFKGASIDDLLDAVSSSSDKVRVCAEGILNNIIINTHKTTNDGLEMTKNIGSMTHQTGGKVGELHKKVDEMLERQKSLQRTLNAISGKNGLLEFLDEYISLCPKILNEEEPKLT